MNFFQQNQNTCCFANSLVFLCGIFSGRPPCFRSNKHNEAYDQAHSREHKSRSAADDEAQSCTDS